MSLMNSYYQNTYTPQNKSYYLNNTQVPSRQMTTFISDTNKTNNSFGYTSYYIIERKIQTEQLNKEDLSYPILYKQPTIVDELDKKRICHSIDLLNLYQAFSIDELHFLYEMAENDEKIDKVKLPIWTQLIRQGKDEVYKRIGTYKVYQDNIDKNDMMIYDEWKRKKGFNIDNTFEAMDKKVEINIKRKANINIGGIGNPFLNKNNNNYVNTFNSGSANANLTNYFNNISNTNNSNINTGTYNVNPFLSKSNQGGGNNGSYYNPFTSNTNTNVNNNTTTNTFNPFANNNTKNNNTYSPFLSNNNNNSASSVSNPFLQSSSNNNNSSSITNTFNPFLNNTSTTTNNNPFNLTNNNTTTSYNTNNQQNQVYNPFSGTQYNTSTNPFISNTSFLNQQPHPTPPLNNNPFTTNPFLNQPTQINTSITNPFSLPAPSPIVLTPTNQTFYQTQQPSNNSFLTPIKNSNYTTINPYYSANNPYYVMPVSFILPTNSPTAMFTPSKQLTSKEYEDIFNKAQLTFSQKSFKDELSESELEVKEMRQDSFVLSAFKKKRKTINSETQSNVHISSAELYWNRKMKGNLSYYSANRNKSKTPSKTFDIAEFINKFKNDDNKRNNDVIQEEEEIDTDSKKLLKIEKPTNIVYNLLCKIIFIKNNNFNDNERNSVNVSLKYNNSIIHSNLLKTDLIKSIKCIPTYNDILIKSENMEFKQSFLNANEIDLSKVETADQYFENLIQIKIINIECFVKTVNENKDISFVSDHNEMIENIAEKSKYEIITPDITQLNQNQLTQVENLVIESDKARISFLQPIDAVNFNFESIIVDNKALTIKIDDNSNKKDELKQLQIRFDIVFKGMFIEETEESFLQNIVEPCLNNLNTETFEYDSKKGELQISNLNLNNFL